ncbi:hypothetical protein [Urechidicola vernalis]|uniref:Uncharacterized protein n=1 Tax=Urechidicola vernalis TaxID=3075600 RepID=A0ABU2Y2D8_9FLAO|nr:hypothetical protein [Urechidicola sp. P050]MDT0551804.1 hypothetical protein [Urechidicola sp. P050]
MRTSVKISVLMAGIILMACSQKKEPHRVAINKAIENPIVENGSNNVTFENRSVVFITGYDTGSKTYYTDAKEYFASQDVEIVDTAYSLQEMLLWLNINYNDKPYSEIHIVSNNKWTELPLETTIKGERVNAQSIQKIISSGALPVLNSNVLQPASKLILHASNLGANTPLLDGFKQAFSTEVSPTVVAAEMVSVFGSEFTSHYLAKPYYTFYPTANSPGRVDLAKQFKKAYPNAEVDWLSVMNNQTERYQGDIYSYKFNIPLNYEIDFESDEEIPNFNSTEDLKAWMKDNEKISKDLEVLGIPLEKFRLYETVRNETLIIKGKVTVVCVLEPVMNPAYPSDYMIPTIENLRLYNNL